MGIPGKENGFRGMRLAKTLRSLGTQKKISVTVYSEPGGAGKQASSDPQDFAGDHGHLGIVCHNIQ